VDRQSVKELLASIRPSEEHFEVILSGKQSRKVNGLYKPDSREIILHNKNFRTDGELVYTAIHEYAHHIQFTTSPTPISARAHTTAFWALFHELLFEAERRGLYQSPFESIPELAAITREIRSRFLAEGGSRMKELGAMLVKAHELCEGHGASFADYLDRVLGLPRSSAQAIVKSHELDLDPRVGFENMRTLVAIRDPQVRERAQAALLAGDSPDMVKSRYGLPAKPASARDALIAERDRIERTISRLRERLQEIDRRLGGRPAGGRKAGG
jgi:hypothetical protein